MKVKIKKLSDIAIVPACQKLGDCGLDFTATSVTETDMYIEYGTDLAIAIPAGFVGLIYPRSSLSNYDLILANSVGVIDQNYRGEIKFRFKKFKDNCYSNYYKVGERIGQIIIQAIPSVEFEEVAELDETVRGDKAYGSSGL